MPLTPQQCRAARGLLDWTQEELAERAGVSRGTVRGFENGRHELHRGSAAVIRGALEAAGVVLLDADGKAGAGVRLRTDRSRRSMDDPAGAG
jgi:transcriptional regulator with XRE-family HTH domain